MKTLSLLLLLLPVACKGPSDGDSSSDTDTADTDSTTPIDTGEPKDSSDPEDTEDTEDPKDSSDPEDTDEPKDTSTGSEAGPNALPDFSLVDVNETSPTHTEKVSPRDYLQKVSGWYFTHAT